MIEQVVVVLIDCIFIFFELKQILKMLRQHFEKTAREIYLAKLVLSNSVG